jgi:hypothetical protein
VKIRLWGALELSLVRLAAKKQTLERGGKSIFVENIFSYISNLDENRYSTPLEEKNGLPKIYK